MTTAWAHLPNAQHIDWVLADLKARPAVWHTARGTTWNAAWVTAWDVAQNTAQNTAQSAAQSAARDAVWGAAQAASHAARDAAWDAVGALIAYDDCGPLLNCPLEHLQRLYRLNPHPSFLLLQPAVIAKNTP